MPTPDQPRDWKNEHANAASHAWNHPMVTEVIKEYAANMGFDPDKGLPAYGALKIAMYAAQVARAQALGFDPELLRLTEDEANRAQMERAAAMVFAGVPTIVVELDHRRHP